MVPSRGNDHGHGRAKSRTVQNADERSALSAERSRSKLGSHQLAADQGTWYCAAWKYDLSRPICRDARQPNVKAGTEHSRSHNEHRGGDRSRSWR